jgi:predicted metalloprotease with PDZ domain
LTYEVDVISMQKDLGSDASVLLPGYAGIMNYSVFGWIEGREKEALRCRFSTIGGWQVFSTIDPKEFPDKENVNITCKDYFQLADGQTMMGPAFQVKKFEGPVPLYVSSYAESNNEYLEDIGWWGVQSMKILKDYFGEIPFEHYSIVRQYFHLLDSSAVSLAMEHMNSATFTAKYSGALLGPVDTATKFQRMFGILHHMGHSYIPLRSYGDDYKPYVLPIAPVIKNIWFNEGFIWFLCADTLKSKALLKRLDDNAFHEDPEIARLPLFTLSAIASTQYGTDFRIGQSTFSRGAMMASEMDLLIKKQTGGNRSMKNVLRYLYEWGKKNKRPFTMEEFPGLLNAGAGVDVSGIYAKWLK